ncbi:MAG: tocopherol cyclase family protein [Calditrichaceae bacterium]
MNIWKPEVYHGARKKGKFFEGWFYKFVDKTAENVYAVIPGIFIAEDPEDSHSFIQVLDGQSHQASYHRFPVESFKASGDKLVINIEKNHFSDTNVELDITDDIRSITGSIKMDKLNPWPVSFFSPGAMGWYAFTPLMECYHGVVSLDHQINGNILVKGDQISFDEGRGYIEKDWGKSFPSAYVWIQSNHFHLPGTSLMVSVARIPWLTGDFRGFIIGFTLDGILYRFTTYTGARLRYLRLTDTHVSLEVTNRKFRLQVEAVLSEGGLLHAPYEMSMIRRVAETLRSQVHVRLEKFGNDGGRIIFGGTGNPAGLDVNGKLEEIVDG